MSKQPNTYAWQSDGMTGVIPLERQLVGWILEDGAARYLLTDFHGGLDQRHFYSALLREVVAAIHATEPGDSWYLSQVADVLDSRASGSLPEEGWLQFLCEVVRAAALVLIAPVADHAP